MKNVTRTLPRLSRLAGIALAAATLASTVHAQQYIYRGMRMDVNNPAQPTTEIVALGLTVRPIDVGNPLPAALVTPNNAAGHPQGMSVVWSDNDADACQLPAFSRPAGGWNGTGNQKTVRVWRLDLHAVPALLPATLAVAAAPVVGPPAAPDHALVTTVGAGMTLANFQAAVAGTAANWTIVAPPAVACP